MKTITAIILVSGLSPVLAAICNNNCGRAVAGARRANPPFASRSSLCAEFVTTYITLDPLASTTTATLSATPAPTITGTKPAWACACPDVTAYWSACQCFEGITATTVTIRPRPIGNQDARRELPHES
ncbi:hypothetical protein LY78DRAFT_688039 [Colletotrichum sublineola]|uniref:Uncharacterized protein n=1 Tax=Colletotrichum sublineola TaxID=1173701 RepID=A0A066XCU8_COLSU|nr:hypothetical protein LY78DRAFT_688039 [Colletotrichum sublineola]KDN63845.1 hypothetical protein CSUB01_04365 [Colletotrichum sublineola]